MLAGVVQVAVVVVLLTAIGLAVRDRYRRPGALESLARALNGHVVPGTRWGTRPQVQGSFEGTPLRLSFPVRWSAATDQRLRMTFSVTAAQDVRIGRKTAAHDVDLLSQSVPGQQRRLSYLFSSLRGSDLVVKDGLAEMTVEWPWSATWLHPARILLPIAEAHTLVKIIEQSWINASSTSRSTQSAPP